MDSLIRIFNNADNKVKSLFCQYLIEMWKKTGNEFFLNLLDILAEQKEAEIFELEYNADDLIKI